MKPRFVDLGNNSHFGCDKFRVQFPEKTVIQHPFAFAEKEVAEHMVTD